MKIEGYKPINSPSFGLKLTLGDALTSAKQRGILSKTVEKELETLGDFFTSLGGEQSAVVDYEYGLNHGQFCLKSNPDDLTPENQLLPFSGWHSGNHANSEEEFLQQSIPAHWLRLKGAELLRHFSIVR